MIDPEFHESPPDTTTRIVRQFAGLWFLLFEGLAGWQWVVHGNRVLAFTLAALGLLVGVLGLTKPRTVSPLFTCLMTLTYPIGWLVSRILLAVLFYGMFTPLALFFRFIGRDALVRRRRPDGSTYWIPRPEPRDARSYFRQS
jgi:hypothetical protein